MSRKLICGVYKITNIKNGLIYIGSSRNINQRWKNHIKELNENRHGNMFLQNDWNIYGKDMFKFEVIEETSEEERYIIEQKYLDTLLPFYRIGKGYNISEKSTTRNPTTLKLFNPKNIENIGQYKIAKVKGCKPVLIDAFDLENLTREEIEWRCYCEQERKDLINYIIEMNGYDDWEY